MAEEMTHPERYGQEGGRWVNRRPEGNEIAEWFTANVRAHEPLAVGDYLGGVTMIQQKERSQVVRGVRNDGAPLIVDEENIVYIPYMRVDTRIRYFWDLMAAHPEWYGQIEPVPQEQLTDEPLNNTHLPEGFFSAPVAKGSEVVKLLGCCMQVSVFLRDTLEPSSGGGVKGRLVFDPPPGTKVVPTLGRYGEDVNAVMKAETGAVGRALGMAGMLVIPGSGVATAEDVQEAVAERPQGPAPEREIGLPDEEDEATLRSRAEGMLTTLGEKYPARLKAFQEWARSRHFGSLKDVNATALKGITRKLEKELDEGDSAGDLAPPEAPEGAPAPAEGES